MKAANPGQRGAPRPDIACPSCGAGTGSCDSVRWLRGRRCCDACLGEHQEVTADATP